MRKLNRPVLVGHDQRRGLGDAQPHAQAGEDAAQRPERETAPAGGRDRRRMRGSPGAVTIATNMAGRGTDIKLGPGVRDAGGLHIIGTERHEARRIDRQLRGRSGRQGDPGSSQFFLSLEDDLMRLFGSDRIAGDHGAARAEGRRRHPAPDDHPLGRAGAAEGRREQLRRSANGCWNTTT